MTRLDATQHRAFTLAANFGHSALVIAAIGLVSPTFAAVSIWDGGGGNDNWTTGAN